MNKNAKLNSKGITLIALIITIVVILLIVGVTVNTSLESLNKTELQGFYTQLEYVQKRIDDIASTNESYIDSNGNKIYLKEQGTALTSTQRTKLQYILTSEGAELGLSASTFKYFTKGQLKDILGLSDIDYNVFVDFDSRTVIGEVDETTYHILKNSVYFVESNSSSDKEKVERLEPEITTYGKEYHSSIMTNTMVLVGTDRYRITITAYNGNNKKLEDGILRYKKSGNKYWNTATNMEFIISDLGQYDIEYYDSNKNIKSKTITVSLDGSGNPRVQ